MVWTVGQQIVAACPVYNFILLTHFLIVLLKQSLQCVRVRSDTEYSAKHDLFRLLPCEPPSPSLHALSATADPTPHTHRTQQTTLGTRVDLLLSNFGSSCEEVLLQKSARVSEPLSPRTCLLLLPASQPCA